MPQVDPTAVRAEHDSGPSAAAASALEHYGDKHLATPSEKVIGTDALAPPETLAHMPAAEAQSTRKVQPAYHFPLSEDQIDPRYKAMSPYELLSELERLIYGRDIHPGQRRRYGDIRLPVCAINLELNLRGGCSPNSRPMRKVPRSRDLTEDEKLLSNDRQVLDLHWLHCRRAVTAGIHRDRFRAEQLDFDWASDFAQRGGTVERKAIALQLKEADQLLLACIQSRTVAERRRTLQVGVESARQAITDIARTPASRLSPQDMERLLNIHVALRIARGAVALACELLLAMTGEIVTGKTMSAKKKWFARHGLPTQ
jgi:hypothetical protein